MRKEERGIEERGKRRGKTERGRKAEEAGMRKGERGVLFILSRATVSS
jgi:hypothetical protein